MAEKNIAKTDMYGMRSMGLGIGIRVRITAGSPIPPDLTDLEEAPPVVSTDIVGDRLQRVEDQRAENKTVTELRSELAARGLETSGNKAELVERLERADDAAEAI